MLRRLLLSDCRTSARGCGRTVLGAAWLCLRLTASDCVEVPALPLGHELASIHPHLDATSGPGVHSLGVGRRQPLQVAAADVKCLRVVYMFGWPASSAVVHLARSCADTPGKRCCGCLLHVGMRFAQPPADVALAADYPAVPFGGVSPVRLAGVVCVHRTGDLDPLRVRTPVSDGLIAIATVNLACGAVDFPAGG